MALRLSLTEQVFIPEWESNRSKPVAEQIRVRYKRLSVEAFFVVQQTLQVNLMTGDGAAPEDLGAMHKRWEVMKHVLQEHVVVWENITLDDGPVTTERLFAVLHPTQMGLLSEVYGAILNASTGDEVEAGNSNAPSEPASEGSASPAATAGATDASANATATAVI